MFGQDSSFSPISAHAVKPDFSREHICSREIETVQPCSCVNQNLLYHVCNLLFRLSRFRRASRLASISTWRLNYNETCLWGIACEWTLKGPHTKHNRWIVLLCAHVHCMKSRDKISVTRKNDVQCTDRETEQMESNQPRRPMRCTFFVLSCSSKTVKFTRKATWCRWRWPRHRRHGQPCRGRWRAWAL